MILTGTEIVRQQKKGRITISPFRMDQVQPNSYDFRLGQTLVVYRHKILDVARQNPYDERRIPQEGILLYPSRIYLGCTEEIMGSDHYVPIIKGKSSVARLGLFVHVTADLIDIGSHNRWTLQLHAVQPLRIYAGMLIGQVTFWKTHGSVSMLYSGKYQGANGPRASEIHRDFEVH